MLFQVVSMMSWVRPRPTPAQKLESVKWDEEEQTGPPWKHMKALSVHEKKVRSRHSHLMLCT